MVLPLAEKLGGAKESANEDARFVLPKRRATRLVMTMTQAELMCTFSLALPQPRAMGDSRNGVADARPVQAGRARTV